MNRKIHRYSTDGNIPIFFIFLIFIRFQSGCVRSGSNKTAATKKHIPPTNVPQFWNDISIGCPVAGRLKDETAEIPKATEPIRFKNAICQEIFLLLNEKNP